MRNWIDTLEKSGQLIGLRKPVDPNTETGAILYKSRDKSIFFKNVAGFPGWRALVKLQPIYFRLPSPLKQILKIL